MAKGKRGNLNDIDNSLLNYTPDDLKNFPQQFLNRFYFQTVTDQEDSYQGPDGDIHKVRGRVKIRIQELHKGLKDNELPWQLPLMGFNNLFGNFHIPQRGTTILVFFLHGDFSSQYYLPNLSYKVRPYMNEGERSGGVQEGGSLEGQGAGGGRQKVSEVTSQDDDQRLKIYDFLPPDIVYNDWNGKNHGTDTDLRYNHQRYVFRFPPQWTENDYIDGEEDMDGEDANPDHMNPEQKQQYNNGRNGREFMDTWPQQKVQTKDMENSSLKSIERPRLSDGGDLLINEAQGEPPTPKMRNQFNSWGMMFQDEMLNKKSDDMGKDWNGSGQKKGNSQEPGGFMPGRHIKFRIYSPQDYELKMEYDNELHVSPTDHRTEQYSNFSNLWGVNMKNMEVWERFFHGGKPRYDDPSGFRQNTGVHEEYHRDFQPLGCISKKAHIKLRDENFYEQFIEDKESGEQKFQKGKKHYDFGTIWNSPDEEKMHHYLVKYPMDWHDREQIQNNESHYDDFRRDEILLQINPFSWKKEMFIQNKDFMREQKKYTEQKYLEFYKEIDFRRQEQQEQPQQDGFCQDGQEQYGKMGPSFFDFVLKREKEQFQFNPHEENQPENKKGTGQQGFDQSGDGDSPREGQQRGIYGCGRDELHEPYKYQPETVLQHDQPLMTKIYKFEPQEDRHYYKQDFLNVLRTSKGHLMGDVNWGQRLEDRYKKEFHSFRPDIKDNKIEYWEKSNVFFQQDWFQLIEESRKIFQPDQMVPSEDTNNVEQKQFKDISYETQDWHKLDLDDSTVQERDFWKGINVEGGGSERIGKEDDEFVNTNDPNKYKELQSTFKDEYINHHEDHFTWDTRKRRQQWYRLLGLPTPFVYEDHQDLNQIKWEFKVTWDKQDVFYKDPYDWQMNSILNHKRVQLKTYDGEEDNENFYEGFDRKYHLSSDKLQDKRKQPLDGKGPYINNLGHETINFKDVEIWFSINNNDSLYMVDSSDYYIDKNNHFSTQRDTEVVQSTEFKNRHYNMLTGVKDNIKDEHIFDTKRSNDMYHFRYRRQNNIIMDGVPDKQESHTDKKYYRYDTDTLMHSKVDFEIFNSTDGSSNSFDDNFTMKNETDDSSFDSWQNTTSTESLSNFSTYLIVQNFNLFNDETYHVIRNEGEHYHPDEHEYQKYLRLNVYDSPTEKNWFDLTNDNIYKHEQDKYSIFIEDQKQFNEGQDEWNFYKGHIHDISGSAPYRDNLMILSDSGKFQDYKVYNDTKNKINYWSYITEQNNNEEKYHYGKNVLFKNDIISNKTFVSIQGDIKEFDLNTQSSGKIWIINSNLSNSDDILKQLKDEQNVGNVTIDKKEKQTDGFLLNNLNGKQTNQQTYNRYIESTGSISEIKYTQKDTIGTTYIDQKSGEIDTYSDKDTTIKSIMNIFEEQNINIDLNQLNEIILTQGVKITLNQPVIELNGETTINGNLHVNGNITCTGSNPNHHSHDGGGQELTELVNSLEQSTSPINTPVDETVESHHNFILEEKIIHEKILGFQNKIVNERW